MGKHSMKHPLFVIIALTLVACQSSKAKLPEPVANNALTQYDGAVYSFAGLGAGKAWNDVHAKAFKCFVETSRCESLPSLPDGVGRLAATAKTIGDTIYIFGGYTVSEDHSEVSTPEVFAFNPKTQEYKRRANIPTPVDDSVSLVYQGRYIYLVSGWHKDTNVADVQIYDTVTDNWSRATNWPGVPVFGHAGGIVGSVMVICDGVYINPPINDTARRTFETLSACWRGDIDADNNTTIKWTKLPQLPGTGLYRMAATGVTKQNLILFAGGSDNAYNYNGIGYNKVPSAPSARVWGYDITANDYVVFDDKPTATMDHRGLMELDEGYFATLGGIGEGQVVLDTLDPFKLQ